MGRNVVRVAEKTSYVLPYISPLLWDVVWYVSGRWCMAADWLKKFAKNSWKLDKADKTRCTWPFQAQNRCDVMLANRRAPGVWFILGFSMYLFLAPKWPDIPVFGKNPLINCIHAQPDWFYIDIYQCILFTWSSIWIPVLVSKPRRRPVSFTGIYIIIVWDFKTMHSKISSWKKRYNFFLDLFCFMGMFMNYCRWSPCCKLSDGKDNNDN